MKNILKKHIIKIPNDINLIYVKRKKIVIFINSFHKRLLKLDIQIFINKSKKFLLVSRIPFTNIPNNKQKFLNAFQGINVSLIKQFLIDISTFLYVKLKFIGVGYRVFNIDDFKNKLLLFKLGYSHFLYFKLLKNVKYFINIKMMKLFIFGHSFQSITQIASLIRSYKKPEPYNGKGILYETEQITLKKVKKV